MLAAHRAGWDPQPGLALVHLASGDVVTAAASIREALERPVRMPWEERTPNTQLQRAPLLEAQVEIAAGEIDRARSAADELELVGARFESKALLASAAVARGRARVADGDAASGQQSFSEAVRLWNEVGASYEAAIARKGLAEATAPAGVRTSPSWRYTRQASPSRDPGSAESGPGGRCHARRTRRAADWQRKRVSSRG